MLQQYNCFYKLAHSSGQILGNNFPRTSIWQSLRPFYFHSCRCEWLYGAAKKRMLCPGKVLLLSIFKPCCIYGLGANNSSHQDLQYCWERGDSSKSKRFLSIQCWSNTNKSWKFCTTSYKGFDGYQKQDSNSSNSPTIQLLESTEVEFSFCFDRCENF